MGQWKRGGGGRRSGLLVGLFSGPERGGGWLGWFKVGLKELRLCLCSSTTLYNCSLCRFF